MTPQQQQVKQRIDRRPERRGWLVQEHTGMNFATAAGQPEGG